VSEELEDASRRGASVLEQQLASELATGRAEERARAAEAMLNTARRELAARTQSDVEAERVRPLPGQTARAQRVHCDRVACLRVLMTHTCVTAAARPQRGAGAEHASAAAAGVSAG
jgi:hypothetical protein